MFTTRIKGDGQETKCTEQFTDIRSVIETDSTYLREGSYNKLSLISVLSGEKVVPTFWKSTSLVD